MAARTLPRCCRLAGLAIAMGLAVPVVSAHAGDATTHVTTHDNAAQVRAAFEAWRLGQGSVFDLLADDVVWTVAGESPVSGTYRTKQTFLDEAVAPITARLATPIVPQVERIVADGAHVVVLWQGTAAARDGSTYRNHYAWHLELADGRIVRVTAFLDTWALAQLLDPT
ncbi:nuclear transport factor 2 family protein [Luteimonas fraxinea]|uniref:Nuclear transport factor 2 family protein n=1 Tax=Luteimonas fraxinea TaxID=2901869 RepID=A0ABS8UEB6_9GAMM|nr:nuclear transport factor 2 family protein [Luteimonas fraxinea]MCD9097409.1 nuclear transport factor 2 family protein [Luteimonas fraxinea]UHH11667.1 nuclear transport factor 2 family protein [Luteimonas fraxinea]